MIIPITSKGASPLMATFRVKVGRPQLPNSRYVSSGFLGHNSSRAHPQSFKDLLISTWHYHLWCYCVPSDRNLELSLATSMTKLPHHGMFLLSALHQCTAVGPSGSLGPPSHPQYVTYSNFKYSDCTYAGGPICVRTMQYLATARLYICISIRTLIDTVNEPTNTISTQLDRKRSKRRGEEDRGTLREYPSTQAQAQGLTH